MTTSIFFAVLFAACLHAVWNSLVKGSADKHATMFAVVLGHVPGAVLAMPFAPSIDLSALPWIIGGVALHLGYQLFLIAAYRVGDLTLVYPIARGSAPLIVTAVSIGVLGVSFTRFELSGVVLIALGLVCLALVRRTDGSRNPKAVAMALCTGVFIAAYSLVDGIGARVATTALGFWIWAAIGNALALTVWTALVRPRTFTLLKEDRRVFWIGLIGGAASFVAYGVVIWAFTQAPIALVTALRETSIVFAMLIGVGVLKERLDLVKVVSTFIMIFGAILLRTSKS
ncbi:MAG: DMT family transporter [Litoreibacter sp.]